MTKEEAKKIIGNNPNCSTWYCSPSLMARWLNTAEENRRLEAALIFLGKKRGKSNEKV